MSADVLTLVNTHTVNQDAIELVSGLLDRLKSGESVAVALVEVKADHNTVATAYSKSDRAYHLMCSGCARLLTRISQD